MVLALCRRQDALPAGFRQVGRKKPRKLSRGRFPLAARFGVTGIPAVFLLDQSGRVVAMNLRGEKLEAEVKRLLRL